MSNSDILYNPTITVSELTLSPESGSGVPYSNEDPSNQQPVNVYGLNSKGIDTFRHRLFAWSFSVDRPVTRLTSTTFVMPKVEANLLDIDLNKNRRDTLLAESSSNGGGLTADVATYLPNYIKITCVPGNWDFPPFKQESTLALYSLRNEAIVYRKGTDLLATNVGGSNPSFVTALGTGGGTIQTIEEYTGPEFKLKIGNNPELSSEFFPAVNRFGMLDGTDILSGSNFLRTIIILPQLGEFTTSSISSDFTLPNQTLKGFIEIF